MGLRAIDAVQRHSKFNEDLPTPDNFAPYRIMIAIAWYADDNGVAGVAGNHKECPSVQTIADRARVHKNTVLNWLPKLQEAGELKVDKYGAGRGAHLVYTILLEVSPVNLPPGSENGTSVQTDDMQISRDDGELLVQDMTEIKRLLVQQNELLVQALAQANGTNGTSIQTDDVPDSYDPSFDPGDPKGKTPKPPVANDYADRVWGLANRYFKGDVRKTAVVIQAQVAFSDVTQIKQPYVNGDSASHRTAEREWWAPLDQMVSEAEGDLDIFRQTLRHVMTTADAPDGFTVSTPLSAVKTFKAILARVRRGLPAVTSARATPTPAPVQLLQEVEPGSGRY